MNLDLSYALKHEFSLAKEELSDVNTEIEASGDVITGMIWHLRYVIFCSNQKLSNDVQNVADML